jgi:prepilin-type N-terminal cleavage/methylation domain-containing protein
MKSRLTKGAFTLIELLVVVAIIALLLSILLPSLAGAREQGKKAKCLSNLKNLGSSVYQYANEDRAEQVVPIHENMVKSSDYWLWRTANWFGYGGRSAQSIFRTVGTTGFWLGQQEDMQASGQIGIVRNEYSANRRPLNLYMLEGISKSDDKQLEYFACPSDTGYPDDPSIDDSPAQNALRPCYDTLGNSYRASLAMYSLAAGGSGQVPSAGHFALGPWGHRLSTLTELSRTILFGEPTFFNMIGRDDVAGIAPVVEVEGWHKRKLEDNLLFCDGSARMTKATQQLEFDQNSLDQMNLYDNNLLHRGVGWKTDVYPTGGAIIWGDWSSQISQHGSKWPWRGYQDNLRGR